MNKKPSTIAQQWLKSQPLGIIDRLIELAASDTWLAKQIAKSLSRERSGPKLKATDDRLLELRSQGLTYQAIGELVGMHKNNVGKRLRAINKEKK